MKTFSLSEVASMLDVNFSTVYTWVIKGMLSAEVKQKGTRKRYLVYEDDLDGFCVKYHLHRIAKVS